MKIILSIDGGGIRGIVPAAILTYLEEKIQDIIGNDKIRIGNMFDFVAGTSTGSIVGSLMLIPKEPKENEIMAPKYKMSEIVKMYVEFGDKVFAKNFWHNVHTTWGLFGPKYKSNNIEVPLLKFMDHYQLKDLLKACLFSGYDIDKRKVCFFTNSDEHKRYAHYYLKDVIRGSTSIPSCFSPAHFMDGLIENTIIDGAVFVNNPALAAYIEVSKTIFNGKIKKFDPNEMIVISLGTGSFKPKSYTYKKTKRWGKAKWVLPTIDIMMSAHSDVTDYEMTKIFSSHDSLHNYKRINPPLVYGSASALDSSRKNVTNLLIDVRNYIENNKDMLNTLAREICDLNFLIRHYE